MKKILTFVISLMLLIASCNPCSLGKIRSLSSQASVGVQREVDSLSRVWYDNYLNEGCDKCEAYDSTMSRLYEHFQTIRNTGRDEYLMNYDWVNIINVTISKPD